MTAYYLPSVLTGENVMLTAVPATEEYVAVDTGKLAELGFKKACLDGIPIPVTGSGPVNANWLYLQLYANTKQPKWLEKVDTGKLLVPVDLRPGEMPRKLYRKIGGSLYTMAFISEGDFEAFAKGRYREYRLVQADRTEHYVANGIILNCSKPA